MEAKWSNIIVTSGAVSKCLEPIPEAVKGLGIRTILKYFLESTSSNIDIFVYGISDSYTMVSRIKDIFTRLQQMGQNLCICRVNYITIVGLYPQHHVQVISQIYRTLSEILTRFDVDIYGLTYNGTVVFANPRV